MELCELWFDESFSPIASESSSYSSDSCPTQSLLSSSKTILDIIVEEKRQSIDQFASCIRQAKKEFLDCYYKAKNDIEVWTKLVSEYVQIRELNLKAEMQLIDCYKIATLNQLKAFTDVASYLKNKSWSANYDPITFKAEDAALQSALLKAGKIVYNGCGSFERKPEVDVRPVPKFVIDIGGVNPSPLSRPWGVATDATGRILISDRCNHRILVYNEIGEFLFEFGRAGTNEGEFNRPAGLAVDAKCRIIVADKDNHRIQVFTYCGAFILSFGKFGSSKGEMHYPWDVATNQNCEIAVCDFKNYRVQIFDRNGQFLTQIANPYDRRSVFSPRSAVFDLQGNLMVTDFENHCIVIINVTFNAIVKVIGKSGINKKEFFRPQGIDCNPCGNIVVADSKNYRVQVLNKHGSTLLVFGNRGKGLGEFDCPQGIAFHPNGNIIVADLNSNRIQVF